MGQSRISRHLKILSEAGLLTARRDGMWTFYRASAGAEAGRFAAAVGDPESGPYRPRPPAGPAIRDERAKESRRFFDAVAGDWREMKRSLIGEADLDRLHPQTHPPLRRGRRPGLRERRPPSRPPKTSRPGDRRRPGSPDAGGSPPAALGRKPAGRPGAAPGRIGAAARPGRRSRLRPDLPGPPSSP